MARFGIDWVKVVLQSGSLVLRILQISGNPTLSVLLQYRLVFVTRQIWRAIVQYALWHCGMPRLVLKHIGTELSFA